MKYLIILLIIFILFYCINNNIIEKYQNYINPFFKNKTFCNYDKDSKKCLCNYQKDNIGINYKAPGNSCNYECLNKNKEDCNNNIYQTNYYCKINGKCQEFKGTDKSKYISVNNCGTDKLSNQIKLPYLSKKDCEKSLSVCDSYNNNNNETERKKKCLENTKCGYCTNSFGQGKCIEGTAEGPLDLNNNCNPNNFKNNKNKYEYGNFLFD